MNISRLLPSPARKPSLRIVGLILAIGLAACNGPNKAPASSGSVDTTMGGPANAQNAPDSAVAATGTVGSSSAPTADSSNADSTSSNGQEMDAAAFAAFKKRFPSDADITDGSDAATLGDVAKELKREGWSYNKGRDETGDRFCALYYSRGDQVVQIRYFCAGNGSAADGSDGDNTLESLDLTTKH